MKLSTLTGVSWFSRNTGRKGQRGSAAGKGTALAVEALESRELLSVSPVLSVATVVPASSLLATTGGIFKPTPPAAGVALINGLTDPTVRAAALTDFDRDFALTRNDMLDIFSKATNGYTSITAAQVLDLETLVDNGVTVGMQPYVLNLSY